MQKISYSITRSHPDFHIYDRMSLHARETYNVFLSLTRSYFFHRSKREHYPHDMSKGTKALKILGIQQLEVKKSGVFFAVADEGDVDVTIHSTAPIVTIEIHEFDL